MMQNGKAKDNPNKGQSEVENGTDEESKTCVSE